MPDTTPQQQVLLALAQIPHAQVISYGRLAEFAGLGRAARFVGTQLKKLPPETQLPWHRVVSSTGKLSLAPDSQSFKEQVRRLRDEGIIVKNGKVDMAKFLWVP